MKHFKFKIRPQFIDPIAKGVKRHEYRLNNEERRQISNGDRIVLFSNQNNEESVLVSCVGKQVYSSWEDALRENWEEDFSYNFSSFEEVLSLCHKFYKKEDVDKYGIVRLNISPLNPLFNNNRVLLDTNIIIQRESYNNVNFEVMRLYKWFDTLKSKKVIHPITKVELNKYNDLNIRKIICTKLDSYETIIPRKVDDLNFEEVCSKFSLDQNSVNDNQILYQIYEGVADLLITNDGTILKKASLLGIKEQVLSIQEYLKKVESIFPEKIDYKILSVKKESFGNLDLSDEFFDSLKEDYPEFIDWFNNKNKEEAYVFKSNGEVHGFLYIKKELPNEKDYLKIVPALTPKNRLKVGTFKIDEKVSGFRLSERFIKIIFDNAVLNKVDEIYVTLFEDKRKEVNKLRDVLKKWGFFYHGYKLNKNGEKESVFVKKLDSFAPSESIMFNFPNLPKNKKLYMLPINAEYHTSLFPDQFLKNEDMSLYSENKGHLYSLEKIYISGTYKTSPKPGDLIVIYRNGDRYPKKYSSVCTGLCVLEDVIRPLTLDDYLNECKNKSVFTKEELVEFYNNKKYRTVIKLIPVKSYTNKITLNALINAGFIGYDSGPRTFDEVPEDYQRLFLEEDE